MASDRLHLGRCLALGAVLAGVGAGVPEAWAQPAALAPAHPEFEVASIKPNRNPPSGARAISLSAGLSHGRLTFEAVTLRDLIQQAYDLPRDQIAGCPAWCDAERFDLTAKTEDPAAEKGQVMLMLQALLADRFQLTLHRETKDRSGYALKAGKNGSRLKPAGENEVLGFASSGYVRTFRKMPIAGLVSFIAGTARQPVVDMTGLEGSYNFTIDLTPPEGTSSVPDGIPKADTTDVFTRLREAVEDQLGLRIDPQRVSVENLIIEKAERPSEN
jgi:uncharacterized protein (TIGR03435 family)